MLTLLLILIFCACFGFLFAEGMWSNVICLINVVTAALLATNFFEPVAAWLEGRVPSYTYLYDFLVLWGLFALFMAILRGATDFISRVKVRFRKIVDQVGGCFFAAWIGWVMVCFTLMTLHTAPLGRNFMGGSFQPEQQMLMKTAPDRKWLGFVQKTSLGVFSRSTTAKDSQQEPEESNKTRTFDPRGEFMPKYATRRAKLEAQLNTTGRIRVAPQKVPK